MSNYSFIQSTVLSTYCGAFLDTRLKEFDVRLNGKDALIQWNIDPVDHLEKLVVERRMDPGSWKEIFAPAPINLTQYTDRNLQAGSYQYRLRITERNSIEKYSTVKMITVGNEKITIYPNPSSDHITIIFPFRNGSHLKVVNALGEVVLKKVFHHEETFFKQDISFRGDGIYYLVIDDQNIRSTKT